MEVGDLVQVKVLLQIRSNAGGGNPNPIDTVGRTSLYVDKILKNEIAFNPSGASDEPSHAFFRGGLIAEDKILWLKNYS